MKNVLGIVNLHHNANFGVLSNRRTVATTSFLGRYYFVDFVLSNYVNSQINNIEILLKEKPNSLFKHLNLGAKEWAINTKTGGIDILYNEKAIKNSHQDKDIDNLIENKKFLINHKEKYIIFSSCNNLINIDYKKMIDHHIASGCQITLAYKNIKDEKNKFEELEKLIIENDELKDVVVDKNLENVFFDNFIINKNKLIEILDSILDFPNMSLKEIIFLLAKKEKVNVFEFKGFLRCFRTLENYIEYSLEMLEKEKMEMFFNQERPFYTRTYDSPPAIYGKNAIVKESFVANGSIIKGEVTSSIIGRGVVVEEGCRVYNSIIYSGAKILNNSEVEGVIIEKDVVLSHKVTIKGSIKKPAYVRT